MADVANLLIVIVTILTLCLFIKWSKLFNNKRFPPGPWGFPIVGHIPLLGDKSERTFFQWWERYGDVVRIRLGSWNAIVVNGFEAIKHAAERTDDVFSGRPDFGTQIALREAFDGIQMLSFSNFSPNYLQLRKRITAALRKYMHTCDYSQEDLIREETEKLTEQFLKYPKDVAVSVADDVQMAVARSSFQMLYGKGQESEVEGHVKEIIEALQVINKFGESGSVIDVIPWLRYIMRGKVEQVIKSVRIVDWITKDKIKEHELSFQPGHTRDLLDELFAISADLPENDDSYSRRHLLRQCVALFAGGFDPINNTMIFIILYLAANPDVQQRVQKEIDAVLGTSKGVTWKDRENLPYVNATIKEVMRVTTLVPFAVPHYALHDTTLRGYDIDKDTVVLFNLHSVANEKSFWGDPETFRPERLLKADGQLNKEKCKHILSFSAGRRRCAGEMVAQKNIFIMTVTLMQRCTFIKAAGYDLDLEPVRSLVYMPKPFKIIVRGRD